MRLPLLLLVLIIINCKKQEQKGFVFKISNEAIEAYQNLNRTKLSKDLWNKYGFFNIESFNPNFNYYISHKNDSLKIIERLYDTENTTWLCLVNKNNFYLDDLQVAYDNAEGFLSVTSELIEDKVIVKTWNDFSDVKETIDTIQITTDAFLNQKKEKLAIGNWKNETSNLNFKLFIENHQLKYTFTSPKRSLSGTAKITENNMIIFDDFEWSEYAGGAIDEEGIEKKETLPLPTQIGTTINFESNEFVIQNYGNAMNYYTKIEEADEKYVIFKRLQ
ncbi:hypothetical protein [Tenacibaculum jejuense]|uniref:Uncharacterized protein n=1 Tax=Tenacibaculum jejuense TaxID=584609 RepID=A0A238UB06_9FLAO|nr:hypothetical protein [Tenacibaculum jejuense]SNR16255.1 protein of unknown function [Tenacibaculum jejuense]